MKKILLFLFVILFSSLLFSQVDKPQKDTITSENALPDELRQSNVDDGQEDEDSNNSNSFMPSLLHSSRDVYENNSSYNFSIAYFKSRGYDPEFQTIAINGFMMNSLVNGRATFSQWGGLNHVFRYPDNILNMNPATFTFGSIGGSMDYSTRASSYRKQYRFSYSLSNRTYTNRLIATIATGVLKSGWAIAGSISGRFGNAISFVDGTVYNGVSYFFAAEKKFSTEHALNLTAFGSYTQRSIQGNAVQEIYDMLNTSYYNPNWGYFQGKERVARIRTSHEPVIMLSHFYTPKGNKLQITTSLTSTFGTNGTTAINWNEADDPRPDYYRYLPSYQANDNIMQAFVQNEWLNNANVRQINWDYLYEVNQSAAARGLRAQYMLENRAYDHFQFGGSSNFVYSIDNNTKLYGGVDVRGMKQHNYKTISDLLGGSYWLDIDKFAIGDFPDNPDIAYNDLDNKDKILKEGDIFGYDYDLSLINQLAWVLANFSYSKVDFHIGANFGGVQFWRYGNMRNGRFSDNSKGKSDVAVFFTYGIKAGLNYKITGRNYLVLNGQYGSDAPSILNSFTAPRVRNDLVSQLSNEKLIALDLSYIMNYPKIKMRISGFYTKFMNRTKLSGYYDDDLSSMVNFSMTGIDQQHVGTELGAEIKLGSMFSLVMAGTYGNFTYINRPDITVSADNGTAITADGATEFTESVYWKNYHLAGTPQAAATLGIKFNYDYWWVTVSANYFDKIYCDISPVRHTIRARGTLADDDPKLAEMLKQDKLKGQFTLDASISKSWRIANKYTLGFNISATNILNNKKLITIAWQQNRFDFDQHNAGKFGDKYYYALGATFYAGINFQF